MHQMGHCSPLEYPFCDPECAAEFQRAVEILATGADLELLGIEPDSRLAVEARKEVIALRVREYSQWRDEAEREYERSRPRRLEPVARRYFPF
jgi:hypothetical protein